MDNNQALTVYVVETTTMVGSKRKLYFTKKQAEEVANRAVLTNLLYPYIDVRIYELSGIIKEV